MVDHGEHASLWYVDSYLLLCVPKTGSGSDDTMRNYKCPCLNTDKFQRQVLEL